MFQQIIEKVEFFFEQIPPVILFFLVIVIGMYKFWQGCLVTRKENNSIYDMFFFSSLMGLIVGRITYIISNWEEFNQYIWYWLPYEKYGDQTFFFRLLPWRFLRVWDWEINLIVMFVGFVVFATIWTLAVKKWQWSHMYTPIFTTATTMISLSFLLIGLYVDKTEWIMQGVIILVPVLILAIAERVIRDKIIGRKEMRILAITEITLLAIPVGYLVYSYLMMDATMFEKVSIVILLVWFVFGSFVYIAETNKANVTIEKVSSLGTISDSDIDRTIRLSK
ncbi:hypothetical protein GYA44_02340 [Candidatus Microgenomates bacterium]|nr:hypothetical protein [Candidatus Microgenomates bacterium]